MYTDDRTYFSDGQAITASAASTNKIALTTPSDLGKLRKGVINIVVTETFDDTGDNSTAVVTLRTDDNEAFGSAATIATLFTITNGLAAGTEFNFELPYANSVPYQDYIDLYFTVANGDFSQGKITARIVFDAEIATFTAQGLA